jgi:hypothetical protein
LNCVLTKTAQGGTPVKEYFVSCGQTFNTSHFRNVKEMSCVAVTVFISVNIVFTRIPFRGANISMLYFKIEDIPLLFNIQNEMVLFRPNTTIPYNHQHPSVSVFSRPS